MVTRKKKPGYARHAFADMLRIDAGGAPSEQQTATTLDLLNRAGAVSTSTKVKTLHPDWDDTVVKADVAAILAETGAAAPIPSGIFPSTSRR